MHTSKQSQSSDPIWWGVQHTLVWEERLPALRRDFQQRTAQPRQEVAELGPDDALVQRHPTTPRNVGVDAAYAVPDDNWEVGPAWEHLEPALRFGVGARVQYACYEAWDDALEALLREEWEATNPPGTWNRMKRAVRRGFEAARGALI